MQPLLILTELSQLCLFKLTQHRGHFFIGATGLWGALPEGKLPSDTARSSWDAQATACCKADAPACCHMLSAGAVSEAVPAAAAISSVVSCRWSAALCGTSNYQEVQRV